MITISQFISKALRYGGVAVEDANENSEQALEWVLAAIIDKHSEVCQLINKWEDSVVASNSDGRTIDLPSDWDWLSNIEVYTDDEYTNEAREYEIKAGKIRFVVKGDSQTYYVRYRKAPSEYTAVGENMLETANPRLTKILMDSFCANYLATDNDLEVNSAENEMKSKSNNNS